MQPAHAFLWLRPDGSEEALRQAVTEAQSLRPS